MILVTVSDDRAGRKNGMYGPTQKKVGCIFDENPEFGIVHRPYTWLDIQGTDFYFQNKVLLDNKDSLKNGHVYKPWVILTELSKLENGEYLIYSDVSPELWDMVDSCIFDENPGLFDLEVIKRLCASNNDILSFFPRWSNEPFTDENDMGKHTHRRFTSNRCMDKMGLRFYEDCYQCGGGMWVLRKTPTTMAFVEEWLKWNCIDECSTVGWAHIWNDISFLSEEETIKWGFRSDQSIASLLLAPHNHKMVMCASYKGIHGSNFLMYCMNGYDYKFVEMHPRLEIGDRVINQAGTEMTVFRIVDGQYAVGQFHANQYLSLRQNLKKIVDKPLDDLCPPLQRLGK